jgi:hypothetical protein
MYLSIQKIANRDESALYDYGFAITTIVPVLLPSTS